MQALSEERTDDYRISDNPLLGDYWLEAFNFQRLPVQFKELVDLSSLELSRPFLRGGIPLEVLHYRHTFVELCDLGFACCH